MRAPRGESSEKNRSHGRLVHVGLVAALALGGWLAGSGLASAANITCLFDPCYGTNNDDNISGSSTGETIYALDGKDVAAGNSGADSIFGGAGGDENTGGTAGLGGGSGADDVHGDTGADLIFGADGDDILRGNEGDFDQLYAGLNSDNLYGGDGTGDICHGSYWGYDYLDPSCETKWYDEP